MTDVAEFEVIEQEDMQADLRSVFRRRSSSRWRTEADHRRRAGRDEHLERAALSRHDAARGIRNPGDDSGSLNKPRSLGRNVNYTQMGT